MAKILSLKQLLEKKYDFLDGVSEKIEYSFGKLVSNFIMIVWGHSGNGKSSFIMQFIKELMPFGNMIYVSLEEGHEATMQLSALRQLNEQEHNGKIVFANHEMTYNELWKKLEKKKSPRFIVIDSIQYWNISVEQYKKLKERFPRKTFLFISHAKGKIPEGKTADKIRYDAGIKVRVEKYIAFVETSRYGGNRNYVIWEEGAKAYWGKKFKEVAQLPSTKTIAKKQKVESDSEQLEIELEEI